jgi:hypothetical protein
MPMVGAHEVLNSLAQLRITPSDIRDVLAP